MISESDYNENDDESGWDADDNAILAEMKGQKNKGMCQRNQMYY